MNVYGFDDWWWMRSILFENQFWCCKVSLEFVIYKGVVKKFYYDYLSFFVVGVVFCSFELVLSFFFFSKDGDFLYYGGGIRW